MAAIKEVKGCVEGKKTLTPPLQPSSESSFSPSFSLLTAHVAHVALIQNPSFCAGTWAARLKFTDLLL